MSKETQKLKANILKAVFAFEKKLKTKAVGGISYNPKIHKKLQRDIVISCCGRRGELVGVYWKGTKGDNLLFETSPEKADKIIEIFNAPNLENWHDTLSAKK